MWNFLKYSIWKQWISNQDTKCCHCKVVFLSCPSFGLLHSAQIQIFFPMKEAIVRTPYSAGSQEGSFIETFAFIISKINCHNERLSIFLGVCLLDTPFFNGGFFFNFNLCGLDRARIYGHLFRFETYLLTRPVHAVGF